jgi:hypothetical protein
MPYDITINVSKQNICNADKIFLKISLVKSAKLNPVVTDSGCGGQMLQSVTY